MSTEENTVRLSPVELPATASLERLAFSNFYIHLGLVHAIARSRGVPPSNAEDRHGSRPNAQHRVTSR